MKFKKPINGADFKQQVAKAEKELAKFKDSFNCNHAQKEDVGFYATSTESYYRPDWIPVWICKRCSKSVEAPK